uniref:Peroxisomal membrane protein PEX14-like KPWE domain-containing protein n=1 Tax=Oncorhynchus kisutch TaxID=8019 RepID=A0A8C7FL17_ONCKI
MNPYIKRSTESFLVNSPPSTFPLDFIWGLASNFHMFRLVQAGEEVPGLSKLDIKPNNQTPTPSQMERSLTPFISEDSVFSEGDISTLELLVCSSSAWWQCLPL